MPRYNRKPHQYTDLLQPVKVLLNDSMQMGLIISRVHKLPKQASIEEPYYLVTGIGQPIWEGNIVPISEEEYQLAQGGN